MSSSGHKNYRKAKVKDFLYTLFSIKEILGNDIEYQNMFLYNKTFNKKNIKFAIIAIPTVICTYNKFYWLYVNKKKCVLNLILRAAPA